EWGTRVGVILAVSGSAVGLGNFLRFPGQAVQHGGGAFMIPYLCALLLLALPIGWAEWAMARHGGEKGLHSGPAIMGLIGRGRWARYFGVLSVLIPIVVYMYYVYIEAWCLRYAWQYLVGSVDLGTDVAGYAAASGELFNEVTGIAENGVLLGGSLHMSVVFWLIVVVLNIILVYRGLSGGIEKFCRFAMPAMAILAIIVLIRVLTLGTPDPTHPERSVIAGLGFMWNPDFSKLAKFDTWLAAAGQIFFSLSVGFGVILNYASYLKKKDDVALSGLTASATNELFEVGFGGLITVTAAFVFLGASGMAGGTFGVGFNTLPVVFEHMGVAGRFVGFAWFFLLFLAAITSSISMLQPAKAFFEEALGLSPGRAVAVVSGLCAIGSLWVIWFSKGLVALDTMDFWIGTFAIFILATVQIICFAWIWGIKRGAAELDQGALIRIPRVFFFIMKYVAPLYLLVILIGFAWQNLPGYLRTLIQNPVAVWTMVLIGVNLVLLLVLVYVGERRWRAAGLDIDGAHPDVEPGP
ncbi:MAG TPA: sodium-dependent transporter, partial [Kofleriaceae bacterium]|nr:sodium-dependent transporter [Kofleriaceae bacterium]